VITTSNDLYSAECRFTALEIHPGEGRCVGGVRYGLFPEIAERVIVSPFSQ
jgi:hypothetical protein